jgi:AraC-like DNA-binding protein
LARPATFPRIFLPALKSEYLPGKHCMSKVPAIHFDTADLPETERFERWRTAVPVYEVSQDPGVAPESFQALVDAWFLGEMVVSTNQLPALRFHRTRAKAEADGSDQLSVIMLRRGTWTGELDGCPMSAGPGQIVMFDLTRPTDVFSRENSNITLRIARGPIVAATPGIDLHGFMFEGPIGRVLADHMMLLVRRLPELPQIEAAAVVNATVGLIASCIASSKVAQEDLPLREIQTRHRVFRYVDENIGKPDLTAAKIGKQLGMSRSVLYRAFEPLGGIAQYVRARRLEAAHVQLENTNVASRISDIARTFGFSSDTQFSRAFRTRYGYNPRRARSGKINGLNELAAVVDAHDEPDIFRAWLQRLG